MNFLELAYEQGIKIACNEFKLSFDDVMKLAAMPPPVPSAVQAASRLQAFARGAAKPAAGAAQAVMHTGKSVPVGAGRTFQSAFTPNVLAQLGGGV